MSRPPQPPRHGAKPDAPVIGKDGEVEKFFKPEKRPAKPENWKKNPLNLDNSERKAWLVKIPTFLAEQWDKIEDDDIELGRLKVFNTPGSIAGLEKPKYTLKLTPPPPRKDEELEGEDDAEIVPISKRMKLERAKGQTIPQEYTMQMAEMATLEEAAMVMFSYDKKNGKTSIEGRISQRCNLNPTRSASYHNILSTRYKQANVKTKKVMEVNQDEINRTAVANAGSGWMTQGLGKRKKDQMYVREKMEKMSREELEQHLFTCFEKQPYWNVKDLEAQTSQPASFIREIVKDICNYTGSGPNRGMYSLKTEYHPFLSKEKQRPIVKTKEEDDDQAWADVPAPPVVKTEQK